jgi:C4-dicarboxylate transporter, DctQ subunit
VKALVRAYDTVIVALAVLAGAAIAVAFVLIVADVLIRTARYNPPPFTIATVEYLLLYFTMFAAPWLVRQKGHVYVDALLSHLSGRPRIFLEKFVYLFCVAAPLVFAYFATLLLVDAFQSGMFEERAIDIPLWLLYAPMPIGFALVAVEFARYLFGADRLYEDRTKVRDSV